MAAEGLTRGGEGSVRQDNSTETSTLILTDAAEREVADTVQTKGLGLPANIGSTSALQRTLRNRQPPVMLAMIVSPPVAPHTWAYEASRRRPQGARLAPTFTVQAAAPP